MRFLCHRWSHFAAPVKHRVIPAQFITLIQYLLDRLQHLPPLSIVQIWLPAVSHCVEVIRSGPEEHPEPSDWCRSNTGSYWSYFRILDGDAGVCVWDPASFVPLECVLCLIWPSSLSWIHVLTQCTGNRKEGNRNTLDLDSVFTSSVEQE